MLLEVCLVLFTILYFFNRWRHNYWSRRNVVTEPPEIIFGNIRKILFKKLTMPNFFFDLQKKYKNTGLVGFFSFYRPMLYASDPEIIKRILVTDFNSFSNNGFYIDNSVDKMFGNNPFTAKDLSVWKELRGIQSTMQTTIKLKEIMGNMNKVANGMITYITEQKGKPILIKDMANYLTIDSAVACAYSIEPRSFKDPEFGFIKHASLEKIFDLSFMNSFCPFFSNFLCNILSIRLISKEAEHFFISMFEANYKLRENDKNSRGDLIDAIMKSNNKKIEKTNTGYTTMEMAGYCLTFFMDASVTIAETLRFIMIELSYRLDVQEKLRQEINSYGKCLEDFDYDKIHSMEFLRMVIEETMRLYPPVSVLSRECTKDVSIGDVEISKGTKVFICPYALHRDPDYHPEPEEFRPERFSEENKQSMVKYSYMPFGEGPRICVGMKYAQLLLRVAIVSILLRFRILPTNSEKKMSFDGEFLLTSPLDATLKFEEI